MFGTDVFQPWMAALPGLWRPDQRSLRLLADLQFRPGDSPAHHWREGR